MGSKHLAICFRRFLGLRDNLSALDLARSTAEEKQFLLRTGAVPVRVHYRYDLARQLLLVDQIKTVPFFGFVSQHDKIPFIG